MQTPPSENQRFFAVIPAHNIVYDDLGEQVSPEKIIRAVARGQVKVSPYAEGQTEDDVIQAYKKNPRAQLHAVATLVNFSQPATTDAPSSNMHNFFVANYRQFRIKTPEATVTGASTQINGPK
ncbi:MAG: hypothetical protein ACO1N3_02250 [Gammaproteobacteria bacterium]